MTGTVRGWLASMVLGVALTGCAAGGAVDTSILTAETTGALAAIPKAAASITKGIQQPTGSPTEIYTRIARGLLTCWMGGQGGLRARYLFQAESQPEHQGGISKILLHERIQDAPNQPGRIVFQVLIEPAGSTATVSAENKHLQPTLSDSISQDVYRWAAGEETCMEGGVTEGWAATPAAVTPEEPSKPKRKR